MKKITAKELKREILAICDQYPFLRNPTSGGGCEYFVSQTDPGESQRCLIGEYLSRKGVDVTTLSGNACNVMLTPPAGTKFTNKALRLAQGIQMCADSRNYSTPPRSWGEVAKIIRDGSLEPYEGYIG